MPRAWQRVERIPVAWVWGPPHHLARSPQEDFQHGFAAQGEISVDRRVNGVKDDARISKARKATSRLPSGAAKSWSARTDLHAAAAIRF